MAVGWAAGLTLICETGTKGAINPTTANTEGSNTTEIAMFAINVKQESIGEHIADYFCQQDKRWGANNTCTAKHDAGQISKAKITDRGLLKQLSNPIPRSRGTGIDSIWRSKNPKPYAITEYKGREIKLGAVAMKSLLITESAQDTSKKPAHRTAQKEHRKGVKAGVPSTAKPELKPTIPKMSHVWIGQRVDKVPTLTKTEKTEFKNNINLYSRHIIHIVTSEGDSKIHKEELNQAIDEKRSVDETKHTSHGTGTGNGVYEYTEKDNVFTEAPENQDNNENRDAPKARRKIK